MIEWCWPNMLNVTDCDYTTLPNFLAGTVKHLKMSLECKEDIDFKSASIYKYLSLIHILFPPYQSRFLS